ncbi:FUSC family protein [Streptomyces sp. NPDC088387]|uniref:FUSC family protein n=1 Tax=Streptomyces sp. NPDC088387 TaxID=3365859 RepID=UPI00381C8FF6
MYRPVFSVPPWLAHALRAQRGPVPWSAVVRGALAAGPLLLLAVEIGRVSLGVVAAIAAMLAGINDRGGSRRVAIGRLGVPALAGAAGMVLGTYVDGLFAAYADGAVRGAWLAVAFALLGVVGGSVSAAGPVGSAAGTQFLVASAVGAGMPLPDAGWVRGLAFLAGAGWLIVLRLALPSPRALTSDYLLDGEREAVARVYDAVAALLDAAGTPRATDRRASLTAALDQAQDALAGPRLWRYATSVTERRLHAQYAAALPLAEAATALAWAGRTASDQASEGPRRLAATVRDGTRGAGPLPAPRRSDPALRALDAALLDAAQTFDRGDDGRKRLHRRRRSFGGLLRAVVGAGGREYGLRVGLSFGGAAAVAQALHHFQFHGEHRHWYWLPATAVFLVKPDLGPLASRVLCRAAGTVLGALAFAGFAAVLPNPGGLVALVALCGALIPVSTRHFAAQTGVVTVLVLALVMVGGEPQASAGRIGETLLACVIVLVVGHLPLPGRRGGGVRARLTAAGGATQAYLSHVMAEAEGEPRPDARAPRDADTPNPRPHRWFLRREAYRAVAEARAAIALAEAELPLLARHTEGADEVAALLERLVDTTTACAVHLDDSGQLTPGHTRRLAELLRALDEQRVRLGLHHSDLPVAVRPG